MKKLGLLLVPLAIVGMMVLAGCGKNPTAGTSGTSGTGTGGSCAQTSTITLEASTFQNNGGCVTVTKGQAVTFTSNGTHILCTGPSSGAYSASCVQDPNAPSQLGGTSSGDTFQDGSSQQITFANAGTYNVVCIVHPNMQITIKVQ